MIRAVRTLDCAKKVRIHYLLPRPFLLDDLHAFSDAVVTVREFSRYVAGAKDHVDIVKHGELAAAAVVGENRLVVTFGKLREVYPEEGIGAFERRLADAGFGEVGERA